MSLLNQINWNHHDGVNRPMINDFMRNQFYDNILCQTVKGQSCVDVGFGTGLLSMLAIKHGAKSIVAYESDPVRYELGQTVIDRLGLTKISLKHERFHHGMIDSSTHVIFTETVNGNLWQEGLLNSLPRRPGLSFLPGKYFLEMYACPVPDVFAQGMVYPQCTSGFSPGVDIDESFVKLINELGFDNAHCSTPLLEPAMFTVDTGSDTQWGWIPFMRLCVNNGQLVASYCVDAENVSLRVHNQNSVPFDFNQQEIKLIIDTQSWNNSSVILVPRVGIQHGSYKLMLDTGHWGPTLSPCVLIKPAGHVQITHNLRTGNISYSNV